MLTPITWTKRLVRLVLVLLGLAAAVLGGWMIVTGPVAVVRILRFGDTDVYDFKHDPGRSLVASREPSSFKLPPAAPELFQSRRYGPEQQPLEELLQANDTLAFVVLQDDLPLYEGYFQGHTSTDYSQFFSVSKSVLSALIGMAIDDGLIQSAQQPVTAFVPELAGSGFEGVTLQHLLQMKSGSNYVENDNPFGMHVRLNYTPSLEQDILRFRVTDPPGAIFRYKSGDNALLALVLDRALGSKTITAYTQERLWEPVGMESGAVWSLDHAPDGLEKTWCCLSGTARDLARFGRLYLHQGRLGGEQILSAGWVTMSTQTAAVPVADWPGDFRQIGLENYGYQWWLGDLARGDYLAFGKDGQFLYVDPQSGLIIVRLGESLGEIGTQGWIALFHELAQSITTP